MNGLQYEFFDADFREEPKTKLFCAYCQRDLDKDKIKYKAYLSFRDQPLIFNPKFRKDFTYDIKLHPIGTECAKHLNKDWLIKVNKKKDALEEKQE